MSTILHWLPAVIGILGFAFAIRFYWELHKWAKQCQRARIAIAYNRRVQFQAPLVEWLSWSNSLRDTKEKGRVVYRNGKVTVSILRPEAGMQAETKTKTVRDDSHGTGAGPTRKAAA